MSRYCHLEIYWDWLDERQIEELSFQIFVDYYKKRNKAIMIRDVINVIKDDK